MQEAVARSGSRTVRLIAASAAALGLLAAQAIALAPKADAAHHLVRIRSVFPGTTALPNAELVVLQLTGAGENLFFNPFGPNTSARVRLFNASGVETNSVTATSNPPNSQNQRTVLAATATGAGVASTTADMTFTTDTDGLSNAGGAVCFDSQFFGGVDCVGWGTLTFASPPSPIGALEAAIPADQALERLITPGCSTLHQTADDTNNSSVDFAPAAPIARNNASPITESNCVLTVSVGGGGTGTITGTGITCSTGNTPDCAETYFNGGNVVLTANPTGGSTFGSWTDCPTAPAGNTCTVPVNQSDTAAASFNAGLAPPTDPPLTPVTPVLTPTATTTPAPTGKKKCKRKKAAAAAKKCRKK